MGKLFDFSELETTKQSSEDKSQLYAETFLLSHNVKIESLKKLLGKLPEENEIYFIWTLKSFNAFTFIPYLIKNCGNIDELVITTYSINRRISDALMKLLDSGKIKKITLFISESMKHRMPAVVTYLDSMKLSRNNIEIHYSWVHAKVSLINIEDNYFVVEGSGNWAENAKHEQYIFLKSKSVYEFRKRWILDSID